MEEIWKEINEHRNYQISNLGRVKSLNYKRSKKAKILKATKFNNGYLSGKIKENIFENDKYEWELVKE